MTNLFDSVSHTVETKRVVSYGTKLEWRDGGKATFLTSRSESDLVRATRNFNKLHETWKARLQPGVASIVLVGIYWEAGSPNVIEAVEYRDI